MTTTLQSWEWRFGGVLSGHGLLWAGLILLILFCLAAASVWIGYRHPRAPLPLWKRCVLVLLRTAMLAGLFLCLANPARVTREILPPPPKKPLAVMVDQSGSMTTKDNRGHSRLQDALRTWQRMEPETRDLFSKLQFFSFATSTSPADSIEAALRHSEPQDQTRLEQCINQVLEHAPEHGYCGVLCITDGLDTTGATLEAAVRQALATHTPLYFLPSRNRLQPKPFLSIREIQAPARVMQRTEFSANAVIDCYASTARSIPVTLREDGRVIAKTTLQAAPGMGSYPWTIPVTSHAPGKMTLELSVGNAGEERTGRAEVKVVDHLSINVLVYQGTLDWGYRFLCNALAQDPSFRITGIMDPSTKVRVFSGPENAPKFSTLPPTSRELAAYNIIVLGNAVAENLTSKQQTALVDYVRQGGGILFLESDTRLAQAFSGSALEEMLPVAFSAPEKVDLHGEAETRFRDMMWAGRSDAFQQESLFAAEATTRQTQPELIDFRIPESSKLNSVLAVAEHGKTLEPKFTTYARVEAAKAGARILAEHPRDRTANGEPSILMASQSYGAGRATVLTTDSLWRWKLSLPSTSRDVETFWQQLTMWLAQPSLQVLHFVQPKLEVNIGKPAEFVVDGCREGTKPTVVVLQEGGEAETLPVREGTGDTYAAVWTPKEAGQWTLRASDPAGNESTALLEAVDAQATLEMANIPPDLALMRRVAESTGGELLQSALPASWKSLATGQTGEVISEHALFLWNQWPFLLVCIGLYFLELVLRRFWKLI